MRSPIRLCVILLLLTSLSNASTVQATPLSCPAVRQAEHILSSFLHPDLWTIVVVCNVRTWDGLRIRYDVIRTNAAFTFRNERITIVNAAMFDYAVSLAQAQFVLAHEAGHIICKCDDEARADAEAMKLLKR
jgi:Zn-dependent peptidase ImmA (M78 family)